MATIIKRDGRQRVRVNGPDGTRYITKQEAVVTQIGNKAANGDLAAARLYVALHQHVEAAEQNKPSPQLASERDTAGKGSFLNDSSDRWKLTSQARRTNRSRKRNFDGAQRGH